MQVQQKKIQCEVKGPVHVPFPIGARNVQLGRCNVQRDMIEAIAKLHLQPTLTEAESLGPVWGNLIKRSRQIFSSVVIGGPR
jgi:hypothetical protein